MSVTVDLHRQRLLRQDVVTVSKSGRCTKKLIERPSGPAGGSPSPMRARPPHTRGVTGRRLLERGFPLSLIVLAALAGPGHGRPAAAGHGGVVELNRAVAGP